MVVAERVFDRLHPLLAELAADPAQERAFWARLAGERTPLIEADPAQPGRSLVTYVFPAGEAARVVVQPGFGQGRDHVMERLAGTGVCHAAYRYRDDVRTTYSFGPDMPLVSWLDADEAEWRAFTEFARTSKPTPDPNHREFFTSRAGEGLPDTVASILSLPDAPDASLALKRQGVERGRIEAHTLRSEILGNERRVWVYAPPGYAPREGGYPLIMLFDGGAALSVMPTHRILDNLIADARLAPMVAVFIDNATETSRNDELPCNGDFARFIETELMPWVRGRYSVSPEPNDCFVTGVSYGGLASLWIGLRLPHLVGNVISQSASLWWGPGFDGGKPARSQSYAPEWLTRQYAESPKLPLRIWMEIGLMEPADRMIEPNRRMKAVLEAKGYALTYSEPAGGHDYAMWRTTLPKALMAMAPAR